MAQLTPEDVRADVAEMLYWGPDEGAENADLFEAGLDSIRLLTLIERWRAAGVDVSFVELAEKPTLGDWLTLVASRVAAGTDA